MTLNDAAGLATVVNGIAAVVYIIFTIWLILEQRNTRLDDKLPCVIVRARENPATSGSSPVWWLRLINIGKGPAFIEHFETHGLPHYGDGLHTGEIDTVLGPDVGDPGQQIEFTPGNPTHLRQPSVSITIRYRDISGRRFETRFINKRSRFMRLPAPSWRHRLSEMLPCVCNYF
jgi:hypothetical protein